MRTGLLVSLLSSIAVYGQSENATTPTPTTNSVLTATIGGSVVTYSPQFTVPASADEGANLLPNVDNPNATDAQTVCPGYNASNVMMSANGFSATLMLAGAPCKYVNRACEC